MTNVEALHDGSFAVRAERVASALSHRILPYIGNGFQDPDGGDLRVMAVGINAYVSEGHDWASQDPAWFRGWFERTEHRYYARVKSQAMALAAGLGESSAFGSRTATWPKSFYGTNAIKAYLPKSTGKRASQVAHTLFAEHAPFFCREVELMAEHAVLPHLILIFGLPFWEHACAALDVGSSALGSAKIVTCGRADGTCERFARRVRIRTDGGDHELLLVRMRHPSGRTPVGSAKWLLAQPEFRALAGLGAEVGR